MSIEVPPHPPRRVPILGDIIGLDPVKPMQNTARILASLGPIYQRRILTMRLSFIGGVDLAEDVNDEKRWQKNLARPLRQLRPISGDGLFTAENDEPNWSKAHAILMPGFTQAAMRSYHDTMLDVVREMVGAWDHADAPVDVSEEMSKLTLETIGRAGFGYRFNSYDREDIDPFVTAMLGALEYIQQKGLPIPGRALFDRRRRRRHTADVEYLNAVVDCGRPGRFRQSSSIRWESCARYGECSTKHFGCGRRLRDISAKLRKTLSSAGNTPSRRATGSWLSCSESTATKQCGARTQTNSVRIAFSPNRSGRGPVPHTNHSAPGRAHVSDASSHITKCSWRSQ